MSSVFEEDIQAVLSDTNIEWNSFRNRTVLITGATGLVGGILVRVLSAANEQFDLRMRLIAHGRDVAKCESIAKRYNIETICGDIRLPLETKCKIIDYIFHCAAMTGSADMLARPVDVISTAIDGTRNIIELAKEKQCSGVVFLSSMEVYGQTDLSEVCEKDLGYIDLSNPRSSYPESKRFCESLCVAYAAQYGLPIKIARLARTFGAGTPNDKRDTRVANQFARKAITNEDIELHTPGNSVANCCYTTDVIRGLLSIMLKGENGEAYNIATPLASATIREMAEIVAKDVCGGKIKVIVNVPEDIERKGYAPDVGYTLNADKLKSLGWSAEYGLKDMYKRMIYDWRQC